MATYGTRTTMATRLPPLRQAQPGEPSSLSPRPVAIPTPGCTGLDTCGMLLRNNRGAGP